MRTFSTIYQNRAETFDAEESYEGEFNAYMKEFLRFPFTG